MNLGSIDFVMTKTNASHPRINVAVEFVHDLNSLHNFVKDQGGLSPEKRMHYLYLDRKTWEDMDMPYTITLNIVAGENVSEDA